jgi:chemotaxis protein methyltransferase CheR
MEITDQEIESLTQSILLRYGVDFTGYEMKSFKRRIARILSVYKFPSVHHLWAHLLKNQSFIHTFMNEISVGMTSMFRDPIFWKHMKRILSRQYKEKSELKIWHAGCSTGEEVYSMGILLKETGLLSKSKALATDINQTAIKEAQEGRYHTLKMPENEKNFKEYNAFADFKQYYKTEEDQKNVVMDPELVTHVSFGFHNLTCDSVADAYDLILCRNVMIYFDTPAKNKFMEKFYQALKPGGYFAIGFYDTMLSIMNHHKLELVDEEAKIFQKK